MSEIAYNIRPQNNDLLITAQFVKDTFLFGVDLTDDNGNEMPNTLIEFYIKSAQKWIERELQILLHPTVITNEAHDYTYIDYTNFGCVKLYNFPVRKVTKYAIQFPISNEILSYDPTWFKTDSVGGMVNLIPTEGT